MLEGSGDELARCLWRMDITDPCLCIPLQLPQRDTDTFAMCFAHAIIAAHKGRKRNRLGCGERRIPSCTMLRTCDLLSILILVGPGGLVLNELRISRWVPSFTQASKFLQPLHCHLSPTPSRDHLATRYALADRGSSSSVVRT